MEAKLNALKTQFRKFTCSAVAAVALGGGMTSNAQASSVLDGIVEELKTQTEQAVRGSIQDSFQRPDEDCDRSRTSRSGSGDYRYNQGTLSQRCDKLSYEEQLQRKAYQTQMENRLLQEKFRQQQMLEQYQRRQGGQTHHHHYNGAAAKQEISLSEFIEKRRNCTDVELELNPQYGVQRGQNKCTAELKKRYDIRY